VLERVSAADVAGWTVTARGLYFVESRADGVFLRNVARDGAVPQDVAVLDRLTWPGFTLPPDGAQVLYARWDRRQSNIMAIEY
jgi:hypothetical protein